MTLLREADLLDYPKPPVLVDDLLVAGTLAALVSKPGVGKSFVALDLALSIAAGEASFLGLPLRAHGPVVYVVGEGGGRFKLRLKAWRQHHGIDRPLPFYWTNGPIDLLDGEAVGAFVAELVPLRPRLVVFDTLSRCLVGADENSQATMTEAVAALDRVRTSVSDMTTLVLHHLNAAGTRERGSSVFNGAVDTQLRLKPPKQREDDDADGEEVTMPVSRSIQLVVDKQKDLDARAKPINLAMTEVAIDGEYEPGGAPSTSIVWTRPERSLPVLDRVVAFVKRHPGASQDAVYRAVGGTRQAVYDLLKRPDVFRLETKGRGQIVYLTEAQAA